MRRGWKGGPSGLELIENANAISSYLGWRPSQIARAKPWVCSGEASQQATALCFYHSFVLYIDRLAIYCADCAVAAHSNTLPRTWKAAGVIGFMSRPTD